MTAIVPTRKVPGALPIEIVNQVEARLGHAKGCKKAPEECNQCRSNMEFFNTLSPQMLSEVQNVTPAKVRRFPLREQLVHNGVAAFNFGTSKRAAQSYQAAENFFAYHKAWHPEQYRANKRVN